MTEEEFFKRYTYNVQKNNIGGGSFGTVYKAYDNILDREVAIKVSEVKVVGDKEFSLLVEFEAIAHLPMSMYIANYEGVFRFVERNGTYDYAVMQYYALGNLSHYLKKNEVSLAKRESITKGILEGIAFLHQHKVVHRDLKPSNILVVDRRGEIIPKITDFGLSKQAEADGKASRFTNSFAGGTLQYSSPEQLKGLSLKLNTDLWSFGAIAYEILTRKTLFEAQSQSTASAEWQNEITQKILHADVSKELEILPQNWRAVVSACLEKDVNNRVQDSAVLLAMLSGDETPQKEIVSDAQTFIKTIKKEAETKSQSFRVNSNETIVKDLEKKEPPKINSVVSTKTNTFKEKEETTWGMTVLVTITILIIGVISYFMFFSDNGKTIEPQLTLFKADKFYGYKIGDKTIITPQFTQAQPFLNDSAKVSTKDSSFYINKSGIWLSNADVKVKVKKKPTEKKTIEPNSNKTNEAIKNKKYEESILKQKDRKAWSIAKSKNTIQAYESYLKEFKKGRFKQIALSAINNLKDELYNKKEEHARTLIDNGDNFYYGQRGETQDLNKAFSYYLEAANLGKREAQFNVAQMYDLGEGVVKNQKEAIKWYFKSANNNYYEARVVLGKRFESGDGVEQNFKEAMKWYLSSRSHTGDYHVGRLYLEGKGVPVNVNEAKKWFRKAVATGNSFLAKEALKKLENK